ncbi:glycosyltransferase, partial [Chloroflexota bacterium]
MTHGIKSGATAVTPMGQATAEPLQTEITIDVVIPAFNEGSCIEGVLRDVIAARQPDWLQVQNVYVISDASTDETDKVVRRFASTDPRIRLIRKRQRKGKQHSINMALSVTSADVVVFIDADVRFGDQHSLTKLLYHFSDHETALVQGGLMRVHHATTLHPAKLASHFDSILVDKVRKRKA